MRGRYHHGDLRRALVQHALAALEEGHAPSVRDVARRAGVVPSAFYAHFPDLEALLVEVATEGFEALRGAQLAARAASPTRPFVAMGLAYVRFSVEHPAHFAVMFRGPLRDPGRWPALAAAADAALAVLVEAVVSAGAPPERALEGALDAWTAMHGVAELWRQGPLVAKLGEAGCWAYAEAALERQAAGWGRVGGQGKGLP